MRLNGAREGSPNANLGAGELGLIDRAIAIVQAASAKIRTNDFSAVEGLFAGQALALDAMFDKLARETTIEDLRLALRSQAQCRATLKALMQLKIPRAEKFSGKQTEEPAKSPA